MTDRPDRVLDKQTRSARPHGCRDKIRHAGRKQALGAANEYRAAHPADPELDLFTAYHCDSCRGWHTGHDRRGAA